MIVVSDTRGLGYGHIDHPRSRSMIYPPNRARVAQAQAAAGGWTHVVPTRGLRGLGILDAVPSWVLYGLGGIALGGAVGYFVIGKRRKGKKKK